MKSKVLGEDFFDRPTLTVARDLLGKRLCREFGGRCVKLPIMEVEAYDGTRDKASHAHRGITKRNAVMFGPAGYWYVYRLDREHWPSKGENIVEVTLTRRDADVLPQVFLRDVELETKYLMGKNFHRGRDRDLGPYEASGI